MTIIYADITTNPADLRAAANAQGLTPTQFVARATNNAVETHKRKADSPVSEADILAHWVVRWESATPHERQKMIDNLRITLGDKHAISKRG